MDIERQRCQAASVICKVIHLTIDVVDNCIENLIRETSLVTNSIQDDGMKALLF